MRATSLRVVICLLAAAVGGGGASYAAGTGADAQVDFGVAMARRGLWSEALFRFQQAERLEPNSFRILNNLAVAYEANGMFDRALDYYQRALKIAPSNRELRRNYSRFIEFYQSFKPRDEPAAAAGETPPADPGGG
jgi:tetratricopeptide (TPR) repeat protein